MEKFNEKELNPVDESKGRKGLPSNKSPEEMKFVDEEEDALKESESGWKEHHFQKFVPIEEVADPDTMDMENRMAEQMESGHGADISDEDFEELLKGVVDGLEDLASVDEMRSEAKSPLPPEIRRIIRENSVSSDSWRKMSKEERAIVKQNVQKKIQDYYLAQPKKMVHRKTEKAE